MRICSAYKECDVDTCRHRMPHECKDEYMHKFSTCYDSRLNSACVEIEEGKIPARRIDRCECCGAEKIVIYQEPVEA